MLRPRLIPVLLLHEESLVKTRRFKKFTYVGDPANTVRIFNELEVDELLFLDILASPKGLMPNYKVLRDIADECFMPLAYGGGVTSLEIAKRVFDIGFEKIALNTTLHLNPSIAEEISAHYGSQAVIGSIDVKTDFLGRRRVYTKGGNKATGIDPVEWAMQLESLGVGELLVTSIDREGTWMGFDLDLVRSITDAVSIPVIAHGGAGKPEHIEAAIVSSNASAVGLGSMVVFQKKDMGVLVNFPNVDNISFL